MKPTWQNQLDEARKLSNEELRRHALVCIANNHACSTYPPYERGFTCACVTVCAERQQEGTT